MYTVTFFLSPKGSDDLWCPTASWRYKFLVNGSSYLPFHRGRGYLMGATHMTNQCDEAFAVKQILDFAAREMCIEER